MDPGRVDFLSRHYNAVAADWESASIARVCKKNNVKVMILRGITDIVSYNGSRSYGNLEDFKTQTRKTIGKLLNLLAKIIKIKS